MKKFIVLSMLLAVCGCSSYNPKYQNYYTYAQTRKIVDSKAYPAFKLVFAPLIFIPETIASPVTSYMDATQHPPESQDGHVYMTYVGFRTMNRAMALNDDKIGKPVMYVAWGMITLVDTLWFPVAGCIDTAWIMSQDTPERTFSTDYE